ncbi:LAGLIDADG family homing endonuclease [Streptomyces sp. 351MFTsu5.1]|uniref:LAGLIDADG family homing endonuclease n=1 Tax=Streptomyces sp. 351MFTsu5.1 TaxID=1172180 RepID=UPI000362A260|nr:LAGLIDADG family homing endonuclease [Streptomyces sp. 351MFTsu5.1]
MATAVRAPGYLEGLDAETFDFQRWLAGFDATLLTNEDASVRSEARRIFSRLDPMCFAATYLRHHLRDAQGQITFGDAHLDWCRAARSWVRRPTEPGKNRDAYIAPRNMGKALAIDTPVLTANRGWVAHGDIKPGDEVFSPSGKPVRVVAVSPHWENRPAYRVTFSGGESVIADEAHEWEVRDRWSDKPRHVRETGQIAKNWRLPSSRSRIETRYSVPRYEAVEYPEARLPISPYVLGAWLGDGHSTGVAFTSADSGVIERMEAEGQECRKRTARYLYGTPGLVAQLRKVMPIKSVASNHAPTFEKLIPEEYLTASVEQRLALLQGLMDTDGTIDTNGWAEFCTTTPVLAEGVLRLVRSLGITAQSKESEAVLDGRAVGRRWRICFATDLPVFHLQRKRERLRAKARTTRRSIIGVEQVESQATNCISIDSEDHLYLAGPGLVPTHNSTWWFLILPMWAAAHGHVRFAAAFASSATQAETHLSTFKRELDGNALLRHDYPDLCSPAKRPSGGNVADTQSMFIARSGFVFAARGIDSSNLGMKVEERRPDLILCDDIEPDESSYSLDLARKRRTTLVDSILPLNVYARVVISGTVTMPGSVVHQLVKHARGVETADWIREEGFSAHYTPPIVKRDDGSERSVWPAKWPISYMKAIEATRSFAKNMANDPMGADGDLWTPDDFRYPDEAGPDPVTHMMLSIDPAVTAKKSSDFTGLGVVSWSARHQRCTVHAATAVKIQPGPLLREKVLALLDEFPQIGLILIEVNQGHDTWKAILHDMPVKVKTVSQTEPKFTRAEGVLNHYQRGRVIHARRLRELEEQMCAFPKAPNDDLVDCVGSAVRRFIPNQPRRIPQASSGSYL